MNEQRHLTHPEIRRALLAATAGGPSPDLQARIAAGVRSTRQRRRPILPAWPASPTAGRLAWAAVVALALVTFGGLLVIGAGGLLDRGAPDPVSPVPVPQASPSGGPEPSDGATASPAPTPTPVAGSASGIQFMSPDGVLVTIDVEDRSGRLVGGEVGREGLIVEPEPADVHFANLPGDPAGLRVEWFSPAGCKARYGMEISADARTITIHASYQEGGDSIGGNCGVTLRFSEPVPAGEMTGLLVNTPPVRPGQSPEATAGE